MTNRFELVLVLSPACLIAKLVERQHGTLDVQVQIPLN